MVVMTHGPTAADAVVLLVGDDQAAVPVRQHVGRAEEARGLGERQTAGNRLARASHGRDRPRGVDAADTLVVRVREVNVPRRVHREVARSARIG